VSVGHGELGIRAPLRPFAELMQESASRKDAYVDLRAAAAVSGPWTASGAAWGVGWNKSFDGVPLDVVGMKTMTEILFRVETLADCQAAPGSFSYDVDLALVSPPLWDDGERWDGGLSWDEGAVLYVHLTNDVDPNGILVSARTGFFVGMAGTPTVLGVAGQPSECLVHPRLGFEKLTDGGLNVWTSGTDLTNWTEAFGGVGGFSVNQEATEVYEGSYSAKIASNGTNSGDGTIRQVGACVVGKLYRFWGRYKTDPANASTVTQYVRVGAATILASDGRTNNATDGAQLGNTGGRWRNFFFDFVAHESAPNIGVRLKNSAASVCAVWFDDLHFTRIYRFNYYAPRLQADGLPQSAMAAADIYPGSEETGGGTITCANDGSAYFERMTAPPFYFLGKPVLIQYGGAFQDGQEILDLEPGFYGIVAGDRHLRVSDRQAQFDVEEFRNLFERQLPPNFYTVAEFPGMATGDVEKRRAMLFGSKIHVRPVRIDVTASTNLGIYEVADPTYALDDALVSVSFVWAYTDEDAAANQDATKRVQLIGGGTDYSVDLTLGRITLTSNPGPFVVVSIEETATERGDMNDRVDFVANGTTCAASIPVGCYSAQEYADLLAFFMNLVAPGGTGIGVTYSNTTHKYTVSWGGAGTLSLLLSTGTNKQRNALIIAGFTASDDKTGLTTYTSDEVVYSDSDAHVLRVAATGYRDDAAGTMTGAPNALIEKGPDVLRFLLLRIPDVALDQGVRQIDEVSFVAARTNCPQPLSVYLKDDALTVQDVIDRLENGGFADVVVDGSGIIYYSFRDGVVPASAPTLFDRDYLSFEGYLVGTDAYGTVVVRYNQDPTTGEWKSRSTTDVQTILIQGRSHEREFLTFLRDEGDAADAVAAMGALAQVPVRHFAFAVKGKLLRSKIGDLVLLTRDQALAGVGGVTALSSFAGRIMELTKNYLTGRCEAVVHTNIIPPDSGSGTV